MAGNSGAFKREIELMKPVSQQKKVKRLKSAVNHRGNKIPKIK
jgi:hypothetical protein